MHTALHGAEPAAPKWALPGCPACPLAALPVSPACPTGQSGSHLRKVLGKDSVWHWGAMQGTQQWESKESGVRQVRQAGGRAGSRTPNTHSSALSALKRCAQETSWRSRLRLSNEAASWREWLHGWCRHLQPSRPRAACGSSRPTGVTTALDYALAASNTIRSRTATSFVLRSAAALSTLNTREEPALFHPAPSVPWRTPFPCCCLRERVISPPQKEVTPLVLGAPSSAFGL